MTYTSEVFEGINVSERMLLFSRNTAVIRVDGDIGSLFRSCSCVSATSEKRRFPYCCQKKAERLKATRPPKTDGSGNDWSKRSSLTFKNSTALASSLRRFAIFTGPLLKSSSVFGVTGGVNPNTLISL